MLCVGSASETPFLASSAIYLVIKNKFYPGSYWKGSQSVWPAVFFSSRSVPQEVNISPPILFVSCVFKKGCSVIEVHVGDDFDKVLQSQKRKLSPGNDLPQQSWDLDNPNISFPKRNQSLRQNPDFSEWSKEIDYTRASLVAQWLRICLPNQGTRVRALVWEDPTCRGATRPMSHNYWACASGACAPQQERPR